MSPAVVFDIEANGLNPDTIWCLADSEGNLTRDGYSFEEGKTYYAHNGIGYDYPVMSRLWDLDCGSYRSFLRDTMVLSRLANPSREHGHSLDAWGDRLGFPKGAHRDWSQYSEEMRVYCERDVQLTERVLAALHEELEGFDQQSIDLEHKVAWIIQEQEDNGWLLDQKAASDLLAELLQKKQELEDKVHETFRPRAKKVKDIIPTKTKAGTWAKPNIRYLGDDCLLLVGGPHSRIEFQEFNPGSRDQIAERLLELGWKPTQFTETGKPKTSEKVLMSISGFPEAELIADYLTVQKRIGMVQSWLELVREDGRVHGRVNSNGAVTGRMTHFEPNVAQVTAGSKIYGKEMRSCWIAPEGRVIVGCDASSLELRMLAHYMNDEKYIQEFIHGDIHTVNQQAAGLDTRDLAKTFIYAFLYGAGDAKIGAIVGGTARDGKELKRRFLTRTPALAELKERVELASRRGWLRGLDGRKIMVRTQYAALNTLLQGAGAVLMKQALVNLHTMANAQKLDFLFVGNIHDEIQTEVREDHAERFGKLAVYSIAKAGRDLKLRCPTTGKYKIGLNWSETH